MKAKEMQAIMIEKLKDGPKTMGELAEMTGFSKEQVRERMRRAQVEGLVVMNQQGKTFFYWDKEQWNHVNEKKQDRGPITFGGLNRIRNYIRPGFRIKVCCYSPRKGDEGEKEIRTKHIKHVFRHVVTFKEGGSTTLIHLVQYFRKKPQDRCIQ